MSIDDSFHTVIIGGGQAGLAAGYFLKRLGLHFAILDDQARTGDSWRQRWDSLRLFTPSKYNALPGRPFERPDFYFPSKDEVAGYLEDYVAAFHLPVRHGVKVKKLTRDEQGYRLQTGTESISAAHVIVATGAYQKPHTPAFAKELDASIQQLHSSQYRNPTQVTGRQVLVVGAGNSGAEISLDLARAGKQVWLAGRDVGRIPADKVGRILGGRPYWFFVSRVLSTATPIGRKMMAQALHHGAPLIRASQEEIAGAGIQRLPRLAGISAGRPSLEDGRSLPVESVVWATGFRPEYGWIELPVFDAHGYPRQARGVVPEAPGLYFVGLPFQRALTSAFLGGVGEDAEYIARRISAQPAGLSRSSQARLSYR